MNYLVKFLSNDHAMREHHKRQSYRCHSQVSPAQMMLLLKLWHQRSEEAGEQPLELPLWFGRPSQEQLVGGRWTIVC